MPNHLASSTRSLSYAAPPDLGRPPRFCAGTIVSYNPAAHTCLVALATAQAEVEIPAANYLPAALLVADAQVAVALFSANDPSDGLIIGPYGGSAALGLHTITGAPAAGQVPIGTGTTFALATLTGTPNRVSVASGAGSITLDAPQDLHPGASPSFAELSLSGQLTGAYYASGEWTPSFAGTGTAGAFTYAQRTGLYTRMGSLVMVQAYLALSAITTPPTGSLAITGLPLTCQASPAFFGVSFGFIHQFNSAAGAAQLTGLVVAGTTRIDLYESFANAAAVQVPAANFNNAACQLILSGWYRGA